MALRHYQGSIGKPVGAVWKCPTCHAENTRPLEQGCESCGAGADAKPGGAVAPAPVAPAKAPAPQRLQDNFESWVAQAYPLGLDTVEWGLAKVAWQAGYQAGLAAAFAPNPVVAAATTMLGLNGLKATPAGGLTLALYNQATLTVETLSPKAHATLVAALRFYQENTLVYGPLEGQLTSDEVDQLVASLKDPYGTTDRETPEGETGAGTTGPGVSSRREPGVTWHADDGLERDYGPEPRD